MLANIERLYDFALQPDDGDWTAAESALDAIRKAIALLETSPFSCRKVLAHDSFLRELVIGFGVSGHAALFEIQGARIVTVLAPRHQREEDYSWTGGANPAPL